MKAYILIKNIVIYNLKNNILHYKIIIINKYYNINIYINIIKILAKKLKNGILEKNVE